MERKSKIIGLIGPSGVGKQYFKEAIKNHFDFKEPIVVSTRPKRVGDDNTRLRLSEKDFFDMQNRGEIVFTHQPFYRHWYGFLISSLNNQKNLLTEVHVDNINNFRQTFVDRLLLIGFIADTDYIRFRLDQRGSESLHEKLIRLKLGESEIAKINQNYRIGNIDDIYRLNKYNSNNLTKTIFSRINNFLKN